MKSKLTTFFKKNVTSSKEEVDPTTKTFKILVISNSETESLLIQQALRQGFNNDVDEVLLASSEDEVYSTLKVFPDAGIVIYDYNLTKTNSNSTNFKNVKFIHEFRKNHDKESVAILAIVDANDNDLIPTLLEAGVNDVIKKPYTKEELLARTKNLLNFLQTVNKLKFYAFHDPLTGVYNRRYLSNIARFMIEHAIREGQELACMVIDLDDFKIINDSYGHEVGDLVLTRLAFQLKRFFRRKTDVIARIGGDEFVVFCFYNDEESFNKHVNDFLETVQSDFITIERENRTTKIRYSVSIGIDFNAKNKQSLDEAIKTADHKMYAAKISKKIRRDFVNVDVDEVNTNETTQFSPSSFRLQY
jgi:diguanylate cyclase (GGDEF)-like protein